jgi:hypothetical protein
MQNFSTVTADSICDMCYHQGTSCGKNPKLCVKELRLQDSHFHERSFDEDMEIMGLSNRRIRSSFF